MTRRIFLSYRRADTASEALSVGQFLEREFGRGSVFMDIDIHAGADFTKVLDLRIAHSKVLLAMIGPSWLEATDRAGARRLDDPEDWVRQEIARALARSITVIPVCVNGAELPEKAVLPNDICELVNRQAAFVTTSRFRNDMAGLVRDIRAIPDPLRWQRAGSIAAVLLMFLLAGTAAVLRFGLPGLPMLTSSHPIAEQAPNTSLQAAEVPLTGTIHLHSDPRDFIGEGKDWTLTNTDGRFIGKVDANSVQGYRIWVLLNWARRRVRKVSFRAAR